LAKYQRLIEEAGSVVFKGKFLYQGARAVLDGTRYLRRMTSPRQTVDDPEASYWEAVRAWVVATKNRYSGQARGELTQCFMNGPFAGWSERQVAELADQLASNAVRFPLRNLEELEWEREREVLNKVESAEGISEGDAFYCPICHSCGEDGCCPTEKSITSHGCKYAQYYAQQVCYDKMVIDEFHKLVEGMGLGRDETGDEVRDPIGDLYDRAWKRVDEKYKVAS